MNITIYTQPNCTYCERAKALMKSKGIEYVELILNIGQVQQEGKTYVPVQHLKDRKPDAKTIPQIFDGRHYIGGFKELQNFLKHD